MFAPISGKQIPLAQTHIISQTTLNAMSMKEALHAPQAFTHHAFTTPAFIDHVLNYAHYASPMIHPVTGKTISSYKRLIHDPEMAEIWQIDFGKDFGGMVQGNDKTGQKGTNSIFVMTRAKIEKAYAQKQMFTYAKIVVDFRPQKEDLHCIRITAGGNLIKYKGDVSIKTADLATLNFLWNSIISTEGARYMCLDIKKIT
jgi:hypothetical protein